MYINVWLTYCWHWPMVSMILIDFEYLQAFGGSLLSCLKPCQVIESRNWCRLELFPNSCWLMPFLRLQDASKGFAQCLSSWNLVRQQLAGRARLGHLSWPIFDRGWAEWKAREHFPWHESPRSSQKSAQIKRMKAKHSKYSQLLFSHLYIHTITYIHI